MAEDLSARLVSHRNCGGKVRGCISRHAHRWSYGYSDCAATRKPLSGTQHGARAADRDWDDAGACFGCGRERTEVQWHQPRDARKRTLREERERLATRDEQREEIRVIHALLRDIAL